MFMNKQISKRILFTIITKFNIESKSITDLVSKDKQTNIFHIFRSLVLEYYFCDNYPNISNLAIKQILVDYLKSLHRVKGNEIGEYFIKSFISYYQILPFDLSKSFEQAKKELLIQNKNSEFDIVYGPVNNNYNIAFEIILAFLTENVDLTNIVDKSTFFDLLYQILCFHKGIMETTYNSNEFVSNFLMKLFSIIYDIIVNKTDNYMLYIEFFKVKKINHILSFICDMINVPAYLTTKNNVPKSKTNLLRLAFKYFDIGLYLMLNYNMDNILGYWIKSNKDIFEFYKNYKLLSTTKSYNEIDSKELMAFLGYSCNITNYFIKDEELVKDNANAPTKLEIKQGSIAETELPKEKTRIKLQHNATSSNPNSKISLFSYCESLKKYLLQDVIDYSELSTIKQGIPYYQMLSGKTYAVASKVVNTRIFAFGSNFSNSLGINGIIGKDYAEPTQCSGLPKSTWSFNYGYFYTIAKDEETNDVYACGCNCGAGLKSRSIKEFSKENRITENMKGNISQIATGNCNASLILGKDGKLYAVGAKEVLIFNEKDSEKIKIPKLICQIPSQKEKIISIALNYKNAFAITKDGLGYALGDNTKCQIANNTTALFSEWTQMALPDKCKRFIQCAIGEQYFLFIIEDMKNKHRLYASGDNTSSSCGVGSKLPKTKGITMCKHCENLEFKSIFARNISSAAISKEGDLYMFGLSVFDSKSFIEFPSLIDFDGEAIVDDVAICTTHVLAIVRVKENERYHKKVFVGGVSEHCACANAKNAKTGMKEIDYFSYNEECVPVKVRVGYDRSYVLTVNQKEILDAKSDIDDVIDFSIEKDESVAIDLVNFYKSPKCNKFINLFKSLNKTALQNFLNCIEEEEEFIKVDDKYNFDSFLKVIGKASKYRNLSLVFSVDEENKSNKLENEGLFVFLLSKFELINSEILKLLSINEVSSDKTFLQKVIGECVGYISSETRLEQFRKALGELPRLSADYRYAKIDRFKANMFYNKKVPDTQFEETIFAQFYNELKALTSKQFFLKSGSRLARIELKNENATDQGGPYHEVFSNFCQELESESLDLFIKTPNNKNEVGLFKDKYMVNPVPVNEIYQNVYMFLGRLMASAVSTGEMLDLNLHPILWKFLLGNEITFEDTESLDCLFYKLIIDLEQSNREDFDSLYDFKFTFKNSNGVETELIKGGDKIKVTFDNLKEYIQLSKKAKINESLTQMESIKKGFNSVIESRVYSVLTWRQLEEYVCGKMKVDVDFLKSMTTYDDYEETDNIIQWFWEWFTACTEEQKGMYIRFAWGRSRLPKKENFTTKQVIAKMSGGDGTFPHAATCFFKLKLPNYSSKKILEEKMNYSILNCVEIDGD